jgi:hypothetical protein
MNVQARNDRRRWIGIALAPILIASVLYGIGSGSVSISVPEIVAHRL